LRRFGSRQFKIGFSADGNGVAAGEGFTVYFHFAFGNVNPRVPVARQRMGNSLSRFQLREPEVGVLMNRNRAVASCFAGHEMPRAGGGILERLFTLAGSHTLAVGLNPDLQQMHRLVLGGVEFAVLHARTGGHVLHLARADHATVAH